MILYMPSIITDDMIKKMCSMSNPIPLQSTGFLNPDTTKGYVPNYVKRGRGGIRYTHQPIYPPASVNSLIQSTVALSGLAESVVEEHIENAIEREDFDTPDYREVYDNLANMFEKALRIEGTPNEDVADKYLTNLYEEGVIYVNERDVEETKGEMEVDISPTGTSDPQRGEGGGYDEEVSMTPRATRSKIKASGIQLTEGATSESPMKLAKRAAGRPAGSVDKKDKLADKFYRERSLRQGLSAMKEKHKLRGAVEPLGEEAKSEL